MNPKLLYQDFALVYDGVMDDYFAKQWLAAFRQLRKKHDLRFRSLADIGCGTGTIAQKLAPRVKQLYLVDQSQAMLRRAKGKCPQAKSIQADMLKFHLPGQVDLVISTFGILHYLSSARQLVRFFRQVRRALAPQGWFCFDYFTGRHIKKHFGGGTAVFEGDDYLSIWHHQWNEKQQTSEIIIEGFHRTGKTWKQHRPEWHCQKAFPWPEIKGALQSAGLNLFYQYALPGLRRAHGADEKRLVLAR